MTTDWLPPRATVTPDERARARLCLLDWMAVTIAGKQRLAVLLPCDGGSVGLRSSAWGLAAASHILDYDDTMPSALAHPSAVLWPVLLSRGLTGERLVDGFLRGVEAFAFWGERYANAIAERRGHPTSALGTLAATYALAQALDRDQRSMWESLRLAGALAAGSQSVFGSPGKALQVGHAAQTAVDVSWVLWPSDDSLDLSVDPLGIHGGFADRFGAEPNGGPSASNGSHPIHGITHKFHASCYATHGALDAFLALNADHTEVAGIEVRIGADFPDVANAPGTGNGLAIKFSMPACLALVILGRDTADPAVFETRLEDDEEVRGIAEAIRCFADASLPSGAGVVTVRMHDGLTRTAFADPGSERPATAALRDRVVQKFQRLVAPLRGEEQAANLVALVLDEQEVGGGKDISSMLTDLSADASGIERDRDEVGDSE